MAEETQSPFSLGQLYQAIEQHLQEQLAGVQSVAVWPVIEDRVSLPAVFVEMAQLEPGLDIGTGETTFICTFEARVITDPIQADHHQQAAVMASQIAVLLRAQTWGLEVEPAEFVQSMQDWTKPELDGYTVWVVEWTQQIYLGEAQWPWPDEPPGTLYLGFDPETGLGNEDKYFRPEDLA